MEVEPNNNTNNPEKKSTENIPAGEKVGEAVKSNEMLVDIDLKAKPKEEPTKLVFDDDFDVDKYVSQKTESEVLNAENKLKSNTVQPEIKRVVNTQLAKLGDDDKAYTQEHSIEDYEDLAELLVYGFDIFMGWALWRVSCAEPTNSASTSPYKVPEERLKRLKSILSRILMKANKKFPLWTTLLFVAVLTYLAPMTKAMALRKENKPKRDAEKKRKKEEEKAASLGKTNNTPASGKTELKIVQKNGTNATLEVPKNQPPEFLPPIRKNITIPPTGIPNNNNETKPSEKVVPPAVNIVIPDKQVPRVIPQRKTGNKRGGQFK